MWDQTWAIIAALLPSIGVGYLFYRVIKAILEGDRNERLAHSRWEADHAPAAPEVNESAAHDNGGMPPSARD